MPEHYYTPDPFDLQPYPNCLECGGRPSDAKHFKEGDDDGGDH